jgi:hypothetical protein
MHYTHDDLAAFYQSDHTPEQAAALKAHLAECERCADVDSDVRYWEGFMLMHASGGEAQAEDIGAE